MEILIILALIFLNGIFAMSELALVSARKFRLESAKKKGSAGAKTALELSENPTRFLSTIQIGITLIGILLGYFGINLSDYPYNKFTTIAGLLISQTDKVPNLGDKITIKNI